MSTLKFVEKRLDDILNRPPLWGSREAVELQFLQLLEVWIALIRPDVNPVHTLCDTRELFLSEQYPNGTISVFFHKLIPEDDSIYSETAVKLRGLRAAVVEACADNPSESRQQAIRLVRDVFLGGKEIPINQVSILTKMDSETFCLVSDLLHATKIEALNVDRGGLDP